MSDDHKDASDTKEIRKDAKGQFARSEKGSTNNGVISAKPRVITGSDDATSHTKSRDNQNTQTDEREAGDSEFHG
ncbi:MAG: hypothetical protein KUA37_14130 [Desulfomicrobium sp.]|uniref:hypothetical protein n=1 Tax=Hoeflea sp. TaxID=1940281 RepID=UPI0025C36332|nr:hypothetical protein [Hoeflea sp.]MBU4530911.1 hypothetical protein [Alphaproteobacteria bacterium]MBV1713121.1 hypothetical protein [Desulfomicrobium sp.]MBU4542362.1 hypothetical protein [Alphaproteobacteria bacterium]MBU4551126.1 hypothetical protein [Alphaproteobacteria bacterium]MBV1786162.1 hypothetical protein [Hoeflea sp.]